MATCAPAFDCCSPGKNNGNAARAACTGSKEGCLGFSGRTTSTTNGSTLTISGVLCCS
jgi:hypothetical protein